MVHFNTVPLKVLGAVFVPQVGTYLLIIPVQVSKALIKESN